MNHIERVQFRDETAVEGVESADHPTNPVAHAFLKSADRMRPAS